MTTRPHWDTYFLGVADAISARADCRRSKVGAVIVNEENHVESTGYNGVAPGQPGCIEGACPRGLRQDLVPFTGGLITDCIAYHAEVNAIRFSRKTWGCTLYVNKLPCVDCFKAMERNGILRVTYRNFSVIRSFPVHNWREEWHK
jgi:dCMP deaminase